MIDPRSIAEIGAAHPGPWRFTSKPGPQGALIQCWDSTNKEVPLSVMMRVCDLVAGRFVGPAATPT